MNLTIAGRAQAYHLGRQAIAGLRRSASLLFLVSIGIGALGGWLYLFATARSVPGTDSLTVANRPALEGASTPSRRRIAVADRKSPRTPESGKSGESKFLSPFHIPGMPAIRLALPIEPVRITPIAAPDQPVTIENARPEPGVQSPLSPAPGLPLKGPTSPKGSSVPDAPVLTVS